jgi:hypothetical protein
MSEGGMRLNMPGPCSEGLERGRPMVAFSLRPTAVLRLKRSSGRSLFSTNGVGAKHLLCFDQCLARYFRACVAQQFCRPRFSNRTAECISPSQTSTRPLSDSCPPSMERPAVSSSGGHSPVVHHKRQYQHQDRIHTSRHV